MVLKILIALAILIAVFAAVASQQSSEFSVTRTATFAAPAPVVFEQVNDLQKWNAWSPWARLDPNAKNTFEGPTAGTGAIMRWAGNNQVGEGSMTITDSKPNELVRFKLEFLKPFAATNTTEFTFKTEGDKTTVIWSMSGTRNFMAKAMSLVFNCEKMVGGQFEDGLNNLKTIVEAPRP